MKKNFVQFHSFLFQAILLFFFPKKNCKISCPIEVPFYDNSSNSCVAENCSETKSCFLNNEIIKTQWLNNIINIEISNMRYVHFASFSNGDMILQGSLYPKSDLRTFLGFKKNGRGFFKDKITNKDSYFYLINARIKILKENMKVQI